MLSRRVVLTAAAALAVGRNAHAVRPAQTSTLYHAGRRLIVPPIGFTNPPSGQQWTPSFAIYRDGGRYSTSFDITTLIPAVVKTYYVDPVSGADGNAGTTRGAPLQKLSTALAKTDVDQIRIINLTSDYIARGTFGWSNTQPTRSVSVINEGGLAARFISCRTGSAVGLAWTVNGTYSNVYQSASTNANAGQAIDFKYSVPALNPVTGAQVPKAWRPLIHVTTVALVASTPGSWYCDNTNVYVRLSDDRTCINDPYLQVTSVSNNGRMPASTNGITVYVQDVDFVGGSSPFLAGMASSSVNGCVFAHNRCSFQCSNYAATNGPNGQSIVGNISVYGYRSGAYNNCADGLNDHSVESDGTTLNTSPRTFYNECVLFGNGTTGSQGTSDNAPTAHDDCRTICLNCAALNSDDGVFAYTDKSRAWVLGCFAGPSLQTSTGSNYGVGALVSAQVWVDGMIFGLPSTGGANAQVASATATLNYTNMGAPSVGTSAVSPGPVRAYVG